MFNFFKKKEKTLLEHLNAQKKVVVDGVIFNIRHLSIDDHLSGLNVLLKLRDAYKKEKPAPEQIASDLAKQKKFLRDLIFAAVVKPELTLKKEETEKIYVDEILKDLSLSQKLVEEILNYTFSKKK